MSTQVQEVLPNMPVAQERDSQLPEKVPDLELGTRVEFTWTLERRSRQGADGQWRKIWEFESYPGARTPESREGIIVGARILTNGRVDYGYYDNPTEYFPEETLHAYLVAFALRRKHVLVLPQHLKVLTCP